MTIESAVADLTTATTNLLAAVNTSKATLDAEVALATTQANAAAGSATASAGSATVATTKASESAGSAASALAIYGSTTAVSAAVAQAQSAASLSAGYAASAGSAIQQDISGVTAAALHRSPNAVTSMFVYDTTKDSDGGAWTEKCQHTSWYNEALNGKWLGACATEAAARAVSGSATGDYFQLTTDGKFYKLNATSGTTEVFRGNKAKFPKIAAIVAEAATVTIYDLTEPGRPMWMRFITGSSFVLNATPVISSIAALNGSVFVASSAASAGSPQINFPLDNVILWRSSAHLSYKGQYLSRRNSSLFTETYPLNLVATPSNAAAMAVLPDAPIDPATGLQVPTIAVGTSGGVSVIKHDGVVASQAYTWSVANDWLTISDGWLFYGMSNSYVAFVAVRLVDVVGSTLSGSNFGFSGVGAGIRSQSIVGKGKGVLGVRNGTEFQLFKTRLSALDKSAKAAIGATYNTGYMAGDIRRAYLADSVIETLAASAELTTNGGFVSDLSGWTSSSTGTSTSTWTAGGLQLYSDVSTYAGEWQGIPTVIGKTYRVAIVVGTGGTSLQCRGGTSGGAGDVFAQSAAMFAAGTYYAYFTALTTTTYVQVRHGSNATCVVRSVSVQQVVADRSYKAQGAVIYGSITKALSSPSASNQLVAYSGFSASNYLQEPYSADLDFGTGEWNVSAWVNIPVTLPVASFPVVGSELIGDPGFDTPAYWTLGSGWSISGGVATASSASAEVTKSGLLTIGKCYQATITATITSGSVFLPYDSAAANEQFISASGTYTRTFFANSTTLYAAYPRTTLSATFDNISVKEVGISVIAERSYSSGSYIKLGVDTAGHLVASAYDGTTTREVITPTAYNTGTMLKARAVYRLDGSLAILVNGVEVAVTRGNPLLTLNNSNAVLTIGNRYALDAPFPGSIALLKLSATAPTPDQAAWMYEQEKHLFRDGAQCLLPDSGNVVDLTYDEATDKWIAVSATNESDWTGLVRTGVTAVPAGSNIKAAAGSGFKLNARSTTSPGVDVTIPAWNLREELVKRAEAAARANRPFTVFDFSGGFTATTVNGNTAITSVASLTYPAQGTLRGATVTGAGIPAGTVIVDIVGTTIYLSKACTANGSAVQIALSDFILPVGYETRAVQSAGALKQEGSTKDWTRSFDGFREKVTFGTAPGYSAFVEIQAVRVPQ